ncbi:hypothetical protein OKW41_002039 [Paraburkholderia sp. UCT70]
MRSCRLRSCSMTNCCTRDTHHGWSSALPGRSSAPRTGRSDCRSLTLRFVLLLMPRSSPKSCLGSRRVECRTYRRIRYRSNSPVSRSLAVPRVASLGRAARGRLPASFDALRDVKAGLPRIGSGLLRRRAARPVFEALTRTIRKLMPAGSTRVRAPLSDREQRRIHQKLEGEAERHRRAHAEAP